jgi:hypothetical protein
LGWLSVIPCVAQAEPSNSLKKRSKHRGRSGREGDKVTINSGCTSEPCVTCRELARWKVRALAAENQVLFLMLEIARLRSILQDLTDEEDDTEFLIVGKSGRA